MKNLFIILFIIVVVAGCKDPYEAALKDTDRSLLVVEGVLNVGPDSTMISLSMTVTVNANTVFKPVSGAMIRVEDKNGNSTPLNAMSAGFYGNALNLAPGSDYRLRIKTPDNKEYLSDFVTARLSPPIDSITWTKENGDLLINANTHDPSNNTRYYQWSFDETWEINSYYYPEYVWITGDSILETPGYHYQCWRFGKSSSLILGSSAQLAEDRISQLPVQRIPKQSEKISVRYSILLKQQSLTKESYEYFQLMKKNTESLGSIFDPQPSEMKGNISCISHPEENVIGYLTASSLSEKRFFINRQEAGWDYPQDCFSLTIPNHKDSIKNLVPTYLPWGAIVEFPDSITHYFFAPASCVDCTKRGGNPNMPSYW